MCILRYKRAFLESSVSKSINTCGKTMKHRFPHHLNTSCFLCVARRACKNHMWTSTMNNKTQNNKTQTTKHITTKQTNTKHRRTQYMCINIYIYIYNIRSYRSPYICFSIQQSLFISLSLSLSIYLSLSLYIYIYIYIYIIHTQIHIHIPYIRTSIG